MGMMQKRKGQSGEREAAREIARLFGVEAFRGCQNSGGRDSPDIKTTISGVHFEVKRCESLRLYSAIQQATDDAGDNVPVVLHRRNGKQWLVIVPLDDLPELATKLFLTMAENA